MAFGRHSPPDKRLRTVAVWWTVCKSWDGAVAVLRDGRELPVRLLAQGAESLPVEDEKSVRLRVDRAKARQRSRSEMKKENFDD